MKKLVQIMSLVLLVAFAVTCLASCNKYPALKKAFEKEGYEESETLESLAADIKEELEKDELVVNLHLLSKGLGNTVLIVEFKSTEDMKKAYDDSATIRGALEDISSNEDVKAFAEALENAGYAKGNCLAIPVLSPLHINDITNIVKSVK